VELDVPPRELCTDNAAMIASAARYVDVLPYPDYLDLDVYATGERAPAMR
jgi:N6-L-threonylcarbamoyladenine synthase